MAKGLFIATIIGTLPELGNDLATKNWGDFAATLVEDLSQGALLYIDAKGSEAAKSLVENAATEVLEFALLTVESMNILNGFGQEDEGESFKTARALFGTTDLALKNAIPDKRWQGAAAAAYRAENEKQRTRVQSLQQLDAKMQESLKRQADMVEDMRNFLGIWKGVITASVFIAIALHASVGRQASLAYQISVAYAAIAAVASKEIRTVVAAGSIGDEVDGLKDKYREIADAAQLPSDGSNIPSGTAGMPKAVETSMNGSIAARDVARLAGAANVTAGALGDPCGQGAPNVALTSESKPAVTHLTAPSGQTAKLPGQTCERPGSAATTEAALADTVDGAGSGIEGTERAPIDVAVGLEQSQLLAKTLATGH